MFNSKFSQIRAAMHAYSRSPLAKGQQWLDQATGVAGHTVSFDKVRAEQIPVIATIADRDTGFLERKNNMRVTGGPLGARFASVIKFLDLASIKEVPGTNGEAWVVVDSANNVYSNFISPTDKPIDHMTLSDGYELKMYAEDGETEISQNCGWAFDYFSGVIHFTGEEKPSSPTWQWGKPKVEGFVYIGKFISTVIDSMTDERDEISEAIQATIDSAIAVQPFKFTSENMTVVGEPYPLTDSQIGAPDYFQLLSIIIPGYVFEITALDRDESVITEIRHLANGDSQVFLDLPWNVTYQCPIINYSYDSGIDGVGNRIPILGKYKFIATTFVTANGDKIPVKSVIDYERHPNDVIPTPIRYENSTPYEPGTPVSILGVPPSPRHSHGMAHFSDDDVIVNVHNYD